MRLAAVTVVAAVGVGTSSCSLASTCPTTVDEAVASTHREGTFVGTGYVVRFVPSPRTEFRGYDINAVRWIGGRAAGGLLFLRSDEIAGIGDGQPVLIIAREGEESSYAPGACPALQPISEDDVGATRSRPIPSGNIAALLYRP